MLNKLLKYDLKNIFKIMVPIYIVAILISTLARGAYYLSDKITLFQISYAFIFAIYIVATFSLPFATWIIGCIRFYKNIVKDEGYLMNTLPVKKSSLILSKLITTIVAIAASTLVSAICLGIGIFGIYVKTADVIWALDILKDCDIVFFSLIFASFFVGVIMQQLLIYLSISIGQMHNKNKGFFSFLYMIAVYYITQLFVALFLIIPIYFNNNWSKYLEQNTPPMSFLQIFLLASLILNIIICFVYYKITTINLEKRLNLE